MVAARHARNYPAGNEILGNKVNRPGDTKDNLDAMLLEEIHRTRPHATCNDMGYVMRCKEWRQCTGLVTRALEFFPSEYHSVLYRIERIGAAVAEML